MLRGVSNMSFNSSGKRRCIVQKLDFENCIVTSIKTSARGRKKLRARITREFSEVPEYEGNKSPDLPPASTQNSRASSPVLLKKQCRKSRSPVFTKRKKIETSGVNGHEKSCEHYVIKEVPSSPPSPVFKMFKKHKNEIQEVPRLDNLDTLEWSQSGSSQGESSSDLRTSFQIEDFTQESKQSVKISSAESPAPKAETSSSFSGELNAIPGNSPLSNLFNMKVGPRLRRRIYKKKSLLGRLHKLQQKQASEKLLWQHQNRKNSVNSLRVSVTNFWNEESNYFLQCHSSDPETTFAVIDSRWVPSVKNIRQGSVLNLHPPWQQLTTKGSMITVLLNVICLDVLEETEEPVPKKKTVEVVPVQLFEADQKLFIDSLFTCWDSAFLC